MTCLMIDVEGISLKPEDVRRIKHPLVGGIILFARNFSDRNQLSELILAIREVRDGLVISVDHEGGRVQRFRESFTLLPDMGLIGKNYNHNKSQAIKIANLTGWIIAKELGELGIDFSFTPVLDIDYGTSSVIGNRSFHQNVDPITELSTALHQGLTHGGMEGVGKHFPGHGSVEGDSHHVLPFDRRDFAAIEQSDLIPFRRVINTHLAGVMMAHVVYEQVDTLAAGFSKVWVNSVLRQQLGFEGVIFSDDLTMSGAESVGGYAERARLSLAAGCDILLVCNNSAGADEVLDSLQGYNNPTTQLRMVRLHGKPEPAIADLFTSPRWRQATSALRAFNRQKMPSESGDLFE